jgi:hypothetical protein
MDASNSCVPRKLAKKTSERRKIREERRKNFNSDRYVSPIFRKLLLGPIPIVGLSEFYRKRPPLMIIGPVSGKYGQFLAMVGQGQRQKKNRPDMATRTKTSKEQDRHINRDTAGGTRVGNFRQKNNSAEDGIYGTNDVPRNKNPRNSVPNPSAEEKTTRNSVLLSKNRSKLSEFPSAHFSGRENNSEFLFPWKKREAYSRNSFSNPSAKEKTTRISVPWNKYRSKLSEFRSEPFRGRETCLEHGVAEA